MSMSYLTNGINVTPPINGTKTSGTFTPSGVWLFSKIADIVLVNAHNVEFN